MAQKTIFKTVFQIEVLSEHPTPDPISLETIYNETENGSWSRYMTTVERNIEVSGKEAVELIVEQGSDPEFFNMDQYGNELDND